MGIEAGREEVETLLGRLAADARSSGYFLNPDEAFTRDLVYGLLVNIKRYGYPSCPCRLAAGEIDKDRDIVCPCDYRDSDLDRYGACYCALYVSRAVLTEGRRIGPVPERREAPLKAAGEARKLGPGKAALPYPVWRCRVCGYLCAREEPPEICPICKAGKDRFERFGSLEAGPG
jgi:ferredoxin-thioredoxin reductase catalytic subunit/rubredoxin